MSTWDPPVNLPGIIHWRRFASNGDHVMAGYHGRVAHATNHVLAYRRKWICSFSQPLNNVAAGVSTADLPCWRTYFRTGHGVDHVEVRLVLAPGYDAAGLAADPLAYVRLLNPSTGATVVTSNEVHIGSSGESSIGPDHWNYARLELAASDDTAYWLQLYTSDYARVISMEANEVAVVPVDDTVEGAVDPRYSIGDPIWDGRIGDIATAQSELLRSNRRHLLSWSVYDGVSTHTNATGSARSVLDGTSAGVPELFIQNQYCNTYSRTTVPCVFAAYAVNTVHSATSTVRLTDNSNNYDITGINGTPAWYTVAINLPAAAATSYEVQSINGSGSTVRVDAFALLEYE